VRGRFFRRNRTLIRPWYERNAARLTADRASLAECYPDLAFHIDDSTGAVTLQGDIIIIPAECKISTAIATLAKFPWDYPGSEPEAYDANSRFRPWPGKTLPDRHITEQGRCAFGCLRAARGTRLTR
jgi:hypothetical protein